MNTFAGIGYFAVPAAAGGAEVIATEVRRLPYEYLIENSQRNGVVKSIDADHTDCREATGAADTNPIIM